MPYPSGAVVAQWRNSYPAVELTPQHRREKRMRRSLRKSGLTLPIDQRTDRWLAMSRDTHETVKHEVGVDVPARDLA
jgi:hypothetical protein